MKLAFLELRRQPRSFLAAIGILTLLASLLMLLGGLLDGLISGSTNAIVAQRADVMVFSRNALGKFAQSRIEPQTRAKIAAVNGVTATGSLDLIKLGARVPGSGPRDLTAVVLFGFEIPQRGITSVPAAGKVIADETLRDKGVTEGTKLTVGPDGTELEVVGFVKNTTYGLAPTLWGSPQTWRDVVAANQPRALLGGGMSQVLLVNGTGSPAALAKRVEAAGDGATVARTPAGVIDADEAVQSQSSTFGGIIGTTLLVAVVVVALFFALLTAERTALYGVLKALGARSGSLFAGVVSQAVVLALVAAVIATAIAVALDVLLPAGVIPYSLTLSRVMSSVGSLVFAAVLGCAFSLRRVLKIDPASAIGGAT